MLSSSPAVPLHSIDFHGNDQRRLSLRTHGGQEYLTAHDGLPSPEHLTPVSGTPRGHTPEPTESAPLSRNESEVTQSYTPGEENNGRYGSMASLNRAPSRRTNVANSGAGGDEVSLNSVYNIGTRTDHITPPTFVIAVPVLAGITTSLPIITHTSHPLWFRS